MRLRPRTWALLLTLVPFGCGGGAGDGGLTGTWWLTPMESGIPGDPLHLTMLHAADGTLAAEVTCDPGFPTGTGFYSWGPFTLFFDFGGGVGLTLSGTVADGGVTGTFATPEGTGGFEMTRNDLVLDCALACEPVVPIRFVSTDYTELAKIDEISLFRSSAGHDYSDHCEDCRSMKHYFSPPPKFSVNEEIEIRSPVDGMVISVTAEGHGASPPGINKQVRIRSSLHPEYTFILFHVDLASAAVVPGLVVSAGDVVGHARLFYDDLMETAHSFDIGVRIATPYGERLVSWFDVITDALFATYQARGVGTRADLILTEAQRDADPLTCSDEAFTSPGVLPQYFVLDPP